MVKRAERGPAFAAEEAAAEARSNKHGEKIIANTDFTFAAEEAAEELLISQAPPSVTDLKTMKRSRSDNNNKYGKKTEAKSDVPVDEVEDDTKSGLIKKKSRISSRTVSKGSSLRSTKSRISGRTIEKDTSLRPAKRSALRAAHSRHFSTTRSSTTSSQVMQLEEGLDAPSLRRTQPAVFGPPADTDSVQLRQPNQRVVKIQSETTGHSQPGAYAHCEFSDRDSELSDDVIQSVELETSLDDVASEVASDVVSEIRGPVEASVELFASEPSEKLNVNKKSSLRKYFLVGIVVLVLVAVGAGVGVALSGSKSDVSPATATIPIPPSEECSMMDFADECSNLEIGTFAVIPECLVNRREEILARLPSNPGVNVTEGGNDCSAESLSLLSVALYASSEDSPITLLNRLGLSMLFYTTNGREWTKGSDWISSKPHCEWDGVLCDEPETGNVDSLSMVSFNMKGPLPSSLVSLLPELGQIEVSRNFLTGTLPPELHGLRILSGAGNEFAGTLPTAFFHSTSLEMVDLSFNKELTIIPAPFVGSQWLGIDLSGTSVEGDFLLAVSVLSNLRTLTLSDASLAGTIPTEIGGMTSLTQLFLLDNSLLGGVIPTELQHLQKIESLALDRCALTGTIPTSVGKLTELQLLYLAENKLRGGMPTELGLLTKLTRLVFHNNDFEGTIPSQVCSLKIDGILEDLGITSPTACMDNSSGGRHDDYGGLICPADMPGCCNC